MAKQKSETPAAEVQVIQIELDTVVKESKIELSKAESHALAFAPSMSTYLELANNIKGLNKLEPTENDAKIARENRLKMVKVRTGAEEIKDLRKEGIRAEGDLIQSLFNVVKNSCLVTENEFLEIEKHQERKEAERKDKLATDRRVSLEPYGTDTTYLPLGEMTDEQFNRLFENEQLAFNARKEAAEKAELARVEAERIAAEKEAERLRVEAEEREKMRIENERLKAEAEAAEKQREIERKEAQARFEAEQKRVDAEAKRIAKENEAKLAEQQRIAKIEADKQASELAKQKAEADKLAAELQAKKDAEAKAETERLAAEKAALNADDKEKVRTLHATLKAIVVPEFTTKEGKEIGQTMREALDILIKGLVSDSKKLL